MLQLKPLGIFNARARLFTCNSIWLNMDNLKRIPKVKVWPEAGKRQAIVAVLTHWKNGVFVTDEGAAREIYGWSGPVIQPGNAEATGKTDVQKYKMQFLMI